MSRNPYYQRLLNSKKWKEIRKSYLQAHPLCERCRREGEAMGIEGGFIRGAIDVHHKVPVESAKTEQEMERLCYNYSGDNLEALCIPCHIKTHQEMRSHTKEAHRKTANDRLQQWLSRHQPKDGG